MDEKNNEFGKKMHEMNKNRNEGLKNSKDSTERPINTQSFDFHKKSKELIEAREKSQNPQNRPGR